MMKNKITKIVEKFFKGFPVKGQLPDFQLHPLEMEQTANDPNPNNTSGGRMSYWHDRRIQ